MVFFFSSYDLGIFLLFHRADWILLFQNTRLPRVLLPLCIHNRCNEIPFHLNGYIPELLFRWNDSLAAQAVISDPQPAHCPWKLFYTKFAAKPVSETRLCGSDEKLRLPEKRLSLA